MDLIGRLHEIGVLSRGEFILKSGKKSDFYIDMRKLVSHPSIIKKIVSLIYHRTNNIQCIAGVPQGGVPYSTYLSALYNIPMVFIRKKAKTYGKHSLNGLSRTCRWNTNYYCFCTSTNKSMVF